MTSIRVAIFASGSGSNARRIMEYFKGHPTIHIDLLISNKTEAGALLHAAECGVPSVSISNAAMRQGDEVLHVLESHQIDVIVLAGFMLLVPSCLIEAYTDRIVNIHPALLPKFGGKGMYGHHVHEAVHEANESESGITIHLVNARYDEGPILAQFSVPLATTDTADDIERKVRALEIAHYAPTIEEWLVSHQIKSKKPD
jgi:phosphoribosylglycinamide formyltransferase-1